MESFIVRKRRKIGDPDEFRVNNAELGAHKDEEEESTDFKLAVLTSIYPDAESTALLECLLVSNGSVNDASDLFKRQETRDSKAARRKFTSSVLGYQGNLSDFNVTSDGQSLSKKAPMTKKGKTLHLYSPRDIETHTPCSIIHNFLPQNQADSLLKELLSEAPSFGRTRFKLFDRVVESPHTMCFYVDSYDEAERQKTEYVYNGSRLHDVRKSLPEMTIVSHRVREVVNREIQRRIRESYPDGKKLKYQSNDEWVPNCSFVNCYDGGKESVGYHADQLTYLGPRAIIGSLSLGVAREFRVRRIIAPTEEINGGDLTKATTDAAIERADSQGQIAIHLPHNSLLVMHAEMQEEWKHSIAPSPVIDPHPIAGNKRINVTYRCYKDHLHPRYTPHCKCGIACVLRCVQRKIDNRGRYMWSCHSHYTPEHDGCNYFQWADFDDDGNPPWATKAKTNMNDGTQAK